MIESPVSAPGSIEPRRPVWLWLAARALPQDGRDEILADLQEESLRGPAPRRRGWAAWQALGIAAHYQGEGYRDPADRCRILLLAALALALLWIVPAATLRLFPLAANVFTSPLLLAVVSVWRAAHLTAAAAAGLLVGRSTLLPPHLDPVRLQLVALLALTCLIGHGGLAALVLAGAAWVGSQARRAVAARPDVSGDQPRSAAL